MNTLLCNSLLVLALFLTGCASTKYQFDYVDQAADKVWPQAPEKPRLQYLGVIRGDDNVKEIEGSGGFATRSLKWFGDVLFGDRAPRTLYRPQSGVVDDEGRKLYVTDAGNKSLFVFDLKQGSLDVWEGINSDTNFLTPVAVCLLGENQIFVSDADHGYIAKFNDRGENLLQFGEKRLSRPTGLACDKKNNKIYVADSQAHAIHVYSQNGEHQYQFGSKGSADGEFNSPTHLAFSNGQLYVSDTLNARVQVFDLNGQWLSSFGKRGLFVGNLPRPKGVAVNSENHVYVIESYYDHLLIFDDQGKGLLPVGGNGEAPGRFNLPAGIWIDNNDQVYVADMLNSRVSVFRYLRHSSQ